LRGEILAGLVRRVEWQQELLSAVERKEVPWGQVGERERRAMLESGDARVRERVARLMRAVEVGERQRVVGRYRAALAEGETASAGRGKVVFMKICATCHQRPVEGENVAPRLDRLADRSTEFLLTSILDPNRSVKLEYVPYQVVRKDGRELGGTIVSETAGAIVVRQPGGIEERVMRKEIASMVSAGLTLMPEGLEVSISEQQMGDLVRYLQGR
jgi:putative heme-binding domain-containing protein